MLDDTLVVTMGEFGRTPRVNNEGGRDHWGHCSSVLFAGGGMRGGNLVGASDRILRISRRATGDPGRRRGQHLPRAGPGTAHRDARHVRPADLD